MSSFISLIKPKSPFEITSGELTYQFELLEQVITTGSTPTPIFSFNLDTNCAIRIYVRALAKSDSGTYVAEFFARNLFSRNSSGVSSRNGTENGIQDSVANTFPPPNRPKITFGDPQSTNIATVIITGKPSSTIHWSITIEYLFDSN